jgi:hypothetical protein
MRETVIDKVRYNSRDSNNSKKTILTQLRETEQSGEFYTVSELLNLLDVRMAIALKSPYQRTCYEVKCMMFHICLKRLC